MSKLHLLLQRIQKPEPKPLPPPPTSQRLLNLLNRLEMRAWIDFVEIQLRETILYLRREVRIIEHLPRCWQCKVMIQLDVERYLGSHSMWYVDLQTSEYVEEQYPDCPKEDNYQIGSYWSGSNDDTVRFILDRAKWAYKITGKQIRIARALLRLVKNWKFTEQDITDFNEMCEELRIYEIALPIFLLG